MIKPAALLMGIVMAAVASGTYFGLDLLPRGLLPPPIGRAFAADAPASPAPVTIVATTPVAAEPVAPAIEPATEPAAEAAAEPAAEAPAVEPAPAAAPPAETAAAAPAPTPAETPAAAPAETPAAAPAAPTETAKAASPGSAPEADAIKPWWPDPEQMPTNQLKLQYAGQVKGQDAIALLFSAPLNLDTLQQHATVRSANGAAVAGTWALGKNPKLAVLGGLTPGRYTVILAPQVADQKGFMLGATLTGPVYVKEP